MQVCELQSCVNSCLTLPVYYDEIAVSFSKLQQEILNFIATLKHYNLEVADCYASAKVLTLDQISGIVNGPWLLEQLNGNKLRYCLLYTSPSPRDKRQSRMPSSA